MARTFASIPKVEFERGMDVQIMGIDGTWRRPCKMIDISKAARIVAIEGGIARARSQGILPDAVVDRSGVPPMPADPHQWRRGGRALHQARRRQEEGHPVVRQAAAGLTIMR